MKRFEATMRMHRSIAAALVAVAAFPAVLWAAEEGQPGLFSVNLGLSVWTIVIFLSLLFILRKYAWGPILSGLEAREEGIQGKLDKAAEEREEASRLLEDPEAYCAMTADHNPYGDGYAAGRITRAIKHYFSMAERPEDFISNAPVESFKVATM